MINWNKKWNGEVNKNQIEIIKEANGKMEEFSDEMQAYIGSKNKQYNDKKWTREYSKTRLKELQLELTNAIKTYEGIETKNANVKKYLSSSLNQTKSFLRKVNSELKSLGNWKTNYSIA